MVVGEQPRSERSWVNGPGRTALGERSGAELSGSEPSKTLPDLSLSSWWCDRHSTNLGDQQQFAAQSFDEVSLLLHLRHLCIQLPLRSLLHLLGLPQSQLQPGHAAISRDENLQYFPAFPYFFRRLSVFVWGFRIFSIF